MNLVPIPYKKYYVKQRNKKIAFRLLLAMSLISLAMSLSITLKREQITKQLGLIGQFLKQGSYESMVVMEERILEQEKHLKDLENTNIKLQDEKLQTLRHLEYLKSAHTNALHIQGYDLNQENKTLEIKGYTGYRENLLDYIDWIKEITHFKEVTFDTISSDQKEELLFTIWIEID